MRIQCPLIMNRPWTFAFGNLLFALLLASPAPAKEGDALSGLEILVISPKDGDLAWIGELLEERGATVRRSPSALGGRNLARGCDLVVLTGSERRSSGPMVPGFTVPVLGVGSAGLAFFGSLSQKHGAPFS